MSFVYYAKIISLKNMKNQSSQILPNWKEISKVLKYKKQDFDNLLANYINHKKEIYNEVKKIKKEDRNFENTFLAIESSGDKFFDTIHQIDALSITHKDKQFRDAATDFQKEISDKSVDLEYDKDIFRSLVEYKEGNYKKEKKGLDQKYRVGSVKLFEDSYKAYKRMGFDLPKVKFEKLKKNSKDLSKLTLDFSKNIDEYKDFILCTEEEMKGLPENFIKSLEKVEGKYKITLDYPNIGPFIEYADSREKRKELADKNAKKGGEKNLNLLAEMVKLRDANAKLLGYKNYLDFSVEDKMSKSEKTVHKFIEDILKKLKPLALKEFNLLNTFAKSNLENYKEVKTIEYFDIAYVEQKLRQKEYSYDSLKVKQYFELDHVLKTMFSIFGELFNFSVRVIEEKEKKEKGIILTDKEVRLVEIKDKKTKQIIAYQILDLFPRDGKYGHAAHTKFCTGINTVYVDMLICNFQKPTKNLPSLLTVREVETIFHELGHGLHCILSNKAHFSQRGTNCDHDFVETPSQFLENFFYQEKNLKKIAIHYKTKKVLDKETIKKITGGKSFMKASTFNRQGVVSLFDIDLHSNKVSINNKGLNIAKEFTKTSKKYNPIDVSKSSLFPAGLIHMTDYAAGYYSYMWALVYAQDFYSEFKKVENDKNKLKEIGERYRKEILEVGGSRDEMESVKKFLGRAPNNKAFLEEIGAN